MINVIPPNRDLAESAYPAVQEHLLYDSEFEHDACGVGFICRIDGTPSHRIVADGLQLLENLEHRGATGADACTGDGAGILLQVPHRFFKDRCTKLGIALPEAGEYGVGVVFLPRHFKTREYSVEAFHEVARQEGQQVLGWRRVPTDNSNVGEAAREKEPEIWQVFIGKGQEALTDKEFQRKLYIIRRLTTHKVWESNLPDADVFYFTDLSTRTMIYKGMLTTEQLGQYFPDLHDPLMESAVAMVHSRFSTNTFPQWRLAQPFRYLCHNGEINTLRGNINWMKAREALFRSQDFGDDVQKILPILATKGSDSQRLDNAAEFLCFTGRELPHAMMMLVPEAWEHHAEMDPAKRAFYQYHSCIMEAWDGPATLPFTDGRYVGAILDRNGLRPSRYTISRDGYVVLASEAGALPIDPASVLEKGRLQPGKMLLVDLQEGRMVSDKEIKDRIVSAFDYEAWLEAHQIGLDDLPEAPAPDALAPKQLEQAQQAFGYTYEDLRLILEPMASKGEVPVGSMGDDTPLAVLSDRPRPLFDYFRQLFAQVTNPPLDAIREELVTSLRTNLGASSNLFETEAPVHGRMLHLKQPILTNADLARIKKLDRDGFNSCTLHTTFDARGGNQALRAAMDALCTQANEALAKGCTMLILSDRNTSRTRVAIPSLLATAGLHHHLIRTGRRMGCSILVESGEPREVHHFCTLLGYGAEAVNPYVALETVATLAVRGDLSEHDPQQAQKLYLKAICKGILKVMSKMGISTLQSYTGAQIFEAVGLSKSDVIEPWFTGTVSRLGGVGLDVLAEEMRQKHRRAYGSTHDASRLPLEAGGRFQWRRGGERHLFNPMTVATLQQAVRQNKPETYAAYAKRVNEQTEALCTLRGMLAFAVDENTSISIDDVEPWTAIVKRFKTGAMSYGSISSEVHEALAIAMNRMGGKSNTGEGGEDPARYHHPEKRSRIKQVASGRFGVTIDYLVSADEIQIKLAQGAKPGEGGQLPGEKVYPWIAKTRHSTPYVGLISPPPHHDIYSIEDLAQLIHDLKNANPDARISVKLVSEVGVGTIAAGVAKAKAEVVLISGHDGGTGASPRTSLAHAGLPWELGLAETQQTLVLNGLRSRVKVECDGQLKTGRDVAIAALLGADEFGFATAPLVTLGCLMMRKCHLNTCPVGIATQDPVLREKFAGEPEHVIRYFNFIAEELRCIMAQLGYRTLDEMVGKVERLRVREGITHWKARHLDLAPLLAKPKAPRSLSVFDVPGQDHGLQDALDQYLIQQAAPALMDGTPVRIPVRIQNTNRTVGTLLSNAISKAWPQNELPDDSIVVQGKGSAGQSFGAFGAKGLTLHLKGEANDYFGKGLSGARLIIQPPDAAAFNPHEQIIIGNVAFYGATSGTAFIRGRAGERFAVRNSGVHAVVEGVGDHACEYMTGGRVVVLGDTGRNFAAGMSGGIAYVLDESGIFADRRCNRDMVDLEPILSEEDAAELHALISQHAEATGSSVAEWILRDWQVVVRDFVKVIPREYRRALERLEAEKAFVN